MDTKIPAKNIAELYTIATERYNLLPAFASRTSKNTWSPVSFRELYERGMDLASGLIDLGVNARDHVGLFGENRFEWILTDYAVQFCGAANVPRGGDVTDKELEYIINHAGIKVTFVETEALQDKILSLRHKLPLLENIILMHPKAQCRDGVLHINDVIKKGSQLRKEGDQQALGRISQISEDDIFTLIYTSGTTGQPKGVMLTHSNMISQMNVIPIKLSFTDRILSILPIWHVLERVIEIYSIYNGACTYYTSRLNLREDLMNVHPTFMGSAPRLWESLYQRIIQKVEKSHPVRRALFHIARFLGQQYHESLFIIYNNYLKTKPVPFIWHSILWLLNVIRWVIVLPWYGFFNVTVLESIRKSVGCSLKATVSGGGALPLKIDQFFNYIGITMLEGYGLTETSPVLTVRTESQLVIGTVGPPVPNTEIKIINSETAETIYPNKNYPYEGRGMQGEICARGPQVMKGYYKQTELTENVLKDGWLHTGDIGMVTFNNCVKILGRSKSTIVLSNGENIEPEPIEMQLVQSQYIDSCMLVGQDMKSLGALVVINKEAFGSKHDSEAIANDSKTNLIIEKEIKRLINKSGNFKPHEKIRDFRILPNCFEVGDELTNLYKVKRHVIEQKYKNVIEDIFAKERKN